MNCHTHGELAYHLVKQMPNLEELYLLAHRVDADKVFALPMPNLRVLQLYHSSKYPLDKLAANTTLTNLTTLLCHPHALEHDDEEAGAYIRLPHLRADLPVPAPDEPDPPAAAADRLRRPRGEGDRRVRAS